MAGVKFIAPIESQIAIGTAPIEVTSTTMCTNLNADLLDGVHAAGFQPLDADLTAIAALAPAQGAIMYYGAAGWAALAAGVDGQVLFTRGPGFNPAWDAVSGTGSSSILRTFLLMGA